MVSSLVPQIKLPAFFLSNSVHKTVKRIIKLFFKPWLKKNEKKKKINSGADS